MSETSARFQLPFILPGQAQKELFHNEALVAMDLLLHPAVEQEPLNVPPSAPEAGQCWIVGTAPEEEWAGHANHIAGWTDGGWRFAAPQTGMTLWDKVAGYPLRWDATEWVSQLAAASITIGGVQILGERQPAIGSPSGGTVIDAEARSSIDAIIAALMSHGLIE